MPFILFSTLLQERGSLSPAFWDISSRKWVVGTESSLVCVYSLLSKHLLNLPKAKEWLEVFQNYSHLLLVTVSERSNQSSNFYVPAYFWQTEKLLMTCFCELQEHCHHLYLIFLSITVLLSVEGSTLLSHRNNFLFNFSSCVTMFGVFDPCKTSSLFEKSISDECLHSLQIILNIFLSDLSPEEELGTKD